MALTLSGGLVASHLQQFGQPRYKQRCSVEDTAPAGCAATGLMSQEPVASRGLAPGDTAHMLSAECLALKPFLAKTLKHLKDLLTPLPTFSLL